MDPASRRLPCGPKIVATEDDHGFGMRRSETCARAPTRRARLWVPGTPPAGMVWPGLDRLPL